MSQSDLVQIIVPLSTSVPTLNYLWTSLEILGMSVRGGGRGSGTALAAGNGTVKFTFRDSEDNIETIRLDNVIYVPKAVKNIISIAQWSEDRDDDYGMLSGGNLFLFFWDNDKKVKRI